MNHFTSTHDKFAGRFFMSGACEHDDLTMVIRIDTPKKSEPFRKDLSITIGDSVYLRANGIYFPDHLLKPIMVIASLARQIRLGLLPPKDMDDVEEIVDILIDWYDALTGEDLFPIDDHGDIDCTHQVYFSADEKIKAGGCEITVERWTNGWQYGDEIRIVHPSNADGFTSEITKYYTGVDVPPVPTTGYIVELVKEHLGLFNIE